MGVIVLAESLDITMSLSTRARSALTVSDLEPRIGINVRLRGRLVADFFHVKTHLGLDSNPDVIRHLIHKQASALRRRSRSGLRSAPRASGAGASDVDTADALEAGASASKAPEIEALCLSCALPECDEIDPRCAYQRATGQREAKRARTRAYARRKRAEPHSADTPSASGSTGHGSGEARRTRA
jgi:hypothetical protein